MSGNVCAVFFLLDKYLGFFFSVEGFRLTELEIFLVLFRSA